MIFLRYLTIQGFAYIIDMGIFLLFLTSIGSGPIFANLLAKAAAGGFAFFAHRYFTFSGKSIFIGRQALLYFLLLAANVPIASAILIVMLLWIPDPIIAKFLSDIVCVALSYNLSKYFIFNTSVTSVRDAKT